MAFIIPNRTRTMASTSSGTSELQKDHCQRMDENRSRFLMLPRSARTLKEYVRRGRYEFHMPSSLCLQVMPVDLLCSDPKKPLVSVASVGFIHRKAKQRVFGKTDGFAEYQKMFQAKNTLN